MLILTFLVDSETMSVTKKSWAELVEEEERERERERGNSMEKEDTEMDVSGSDLNFSMPENSYIY